MRRLAAAAIVSLSLMPARGGRADTVGALALALDQGPAPADAVARALEQAGAVRGDRVVLDPVGQAGAAIAAGAVPAEDLAAFHRVAELEAEGWRAYAQVAAEFAAARLGAAREGGLALLALDGGLELYADVSLKLAAVLDQLGRRDEAVEAYRLAAALDPRRPVTTAEFSPDVVAAFEAARAQARAQATVVVRSAPGATVEIDGVAIGRAPARAQVAVGAHVIVARAAGRRARGLAVAVPGDGAELDVALDPDGAPRPLGVGADEDTSAAAIDAAIVYGEVDGVVLAAAAWRAGQPALLGQWCRAAPVRCTPVIEVGYQGAELGAAAVRLWSTLRDARAAARYRPSLPLDGRLRRGGVTGGGGCRLCRNPWAWAGLGAAIVAAGVTTAIVVGGGAPAPVVTVDPGPFTH